MMGKRKRKAIIWAPEQSISDKNYLSSSQAKILVHRCYNIGVVSSNNQ